jgi:hypothetical protein
MLFVGLCLILGLAKLAQVSSSIKIGLVGAWEDLEGPDRLGLEFGVYSVTILLTIGVRDSGI